MRLAGTVSAALLGAALAAAPPAAAGDPLALSVAEAVVAGLANNRGLQVERLVPEIARRAEPAALARFDTALSAEAAAGLERAPDGAGGYATDDRERVTLGASRLLAAGTTLALELDAARDDAAGSSSRLGLTVTQPLLQGRGGAVNLAVVRQARLDHALSLAELRGFAEALVAEIERACWDYLLAGRRVTIVERSLQLAETQLAEVRERIAVGRVAEIEQAAAEAEVALRREALINARSDRAAGRLRLLRLLNPPGDAPLEGDLTVTDVPELPPEEPGPVAARVAAALARRPELVEARLRLERGDLELVRTRNGLLPRLDLFVSLGASGYADSFAESLAPDDGRDLAAGITLSFPLGNRGARAADERARLERRQAGIALANLEQLVEVDVRGAWIEAARLREQVAATAATQRLQEEKLRAETEKFRVGKSTAFLVAQAQRDLLAAETEAEGAVAGLLKALVDAYRLEGTLLERRGIAVSSEDGRR